MRTLLDMTARNAAAALLSVSLGVGMLAACSSTSSTPPSPRGPAGSFLADWASQDWTAMRQLTNTPPADFAAVNKAAFSAIGVRKAAFAAGRLKTTGKVASEPFSEQLTLAGFGVITVRSTLRLSLRNGHWLVDWAPSTIVPQLKAGDQLAMHVAWPAGRRSSAPEGRR